MVRDLGSMATPAQLSHSFLHGPEAPARTCRMSNKQYLGDSVYVEIENDMLKLTTNNGGRDGNIIYIDEEVLANFFTYCDQLEDEGTRARIAAMFSASAR